VGKRERGREREIERERSQYFLLEEIPELNFGRFGLSSESMMIISMIITPLIRLISQIQIDFKLLIRFRSFG